MTSGTNDNNHQVKKWQLSLAGTATRHCQISVWRPTLNHLKIRSFFMSNNTITNAKSLPVRQKNVALPEGTCHKSRRNCPRWTRKAKRHQLEELRRSLLALELLHQLACGTFFTAQLLLFTQQTVQALSQVTDVILKVQFQVFPFLWQHILLQEAPLGLQHFVLLFQESNLKAKYSNSSSKEVKVGTQHLFNSLLLTTGAGMGFSESERWCSTMIWKLYALIKRSLCHKSKLFQNLEFRHVNYLEI